METASDGEYRTEITTEARKSHEPTSSRLRNVRMLADGIRQMSEADMECRRPALAWKLVPIVLNSALSFDCCVVPPEAMASYAKELDNDIVEALFPLFVGQDRLEPLTVKRMRLPRNAGGFDATPVLLRSPMAFLAQYLAILLPAWPKQPECEQWKHWDRRGGLDAHRRLRLMGLSLDERGMPREGDSPNREVDVARVGDKVLRKRQASWKQQKAATKTGSLADFAARLQQLGGDENALWLTTNEGPECVPLDDMEFRINARVRLDLPVIQQG